MSRCVDDWLAWLETSHPKKIDLSLERTRIVYQRLLMHFDVVRLAKAVVTIAGTNGKGSTVAMLESVYQAAGYQTLSFTSPHILNYNERIRTGQAHRYTLITDAELVSAFELIDQMRQQDNISLSYFEFSFLAAVVQTLRIDPDVCLLEVGLGGRLDATNVVDTDLAIVTSIGLDHQQWLGDTRELIAVEKLGITRAGTPCIYAEGDYQWILPEDDLADEQALIREIPNTVLSYCEAHDIPLYLHGRDYTVALKAPTEWQYIGLHPALDSLAGVYSKPRLQGIIQYQNAAAVVTAVSLLQHSLPMTQRAINEGLQHTCLKGRFEIWQTSPWVIADVAHNTEAVSQLVYTWQQATGLKRIPQLVIGILADKNLDAMVGLLLPHVDHWHIARPESPRGLPANELLNALTRARQNNTVDNYQANGYETVEQAMQAALETDLPTLVMGSFVTIGQCQLAFNP